MLTRRTFLAASAATLLHSRASRSQVLPAAPTTRPNVAQIDRARILAAAAITPTIPAAQLAPSSAEFLAFSVSLPALAAATLIDAANSARYATAASAQLRAWFVAPGTRLNAAPEMKTFEPIADLSALGELCAALPFLSLEPELLDEIKAWFKQYLTWLTENRTALLARDAKDRHGSSWLLQTAAAAKLTDNDTVLNECRHRFKTVTVRAQINADGLFPHELTTENPFRNSLYNLDLLGGVCQIISTRFENVWEHELQDGPGMRSAVAKHAYYIHDRLKWPYPADATHFNLLPYRRPALVFAGRAYGEADYVTLWRTLNPDPTDPDILRTFPIRQPVLWLPIARAAMAPSFSQ
jgi:hypothetical protein